MPEKIIYDLIGIGIGPFNLGLAALCDSIEQLQCLFIEQAEAFHWHPGLMIEGTRLQVPFYADLVSLADPTSKYSYMAFLKAKKRMFRFAIHENYFITRKEYNEYCQWVVVQLSSLSFNETCINIKQDDDVYKVITNKKIYYAKHIIIGTGTVPAIPSCINLDNEHVFHSAEYLYKKELINRQSSVTIIGSGQSAAEVFYDLLQHRKNFIDGLAWFTRSDRFYPMEYSKLSLEMSTPDYIDHFYSLDAAARKMVMAKQNMLYKGINFSLINEIYDLLYMQSMDDHLSPVLIKCNKELQEMKERHNTLELVLYNNEAKRRVEHSTGVVVLATGYKSVVPLFLDGIREKIKFSEYGYEANRNYSVDDNNSVFIQNAEMSTHGFNAADLSLGPYRNAVIINAILQREYYTVETGITFQTFGP